MFHDIRTLQRRFMFVVFILSSWIMSQTLSFTWLILFNILIMILFGIAFWPTNGQCWTLHANFLYNTHFFIKLILKIINTFWLTREICSWITKIIMNIDFIHFIIIFFLEVFFRFQIFKFTCIIIVCEKIWYISWLFNFDLEYLLFFIYIYVFRLRKFRIFSLFNFIIIFCNLKFSVIITVFIFTIFIFIYLLGICLILLINIFCVRLIVFKISYIHKTLILIQYLYLFHSRCSSFLFRNATSICSIRFLRKQYLLFLSIFILLKIFIFLWT